MRKLATFVAALMISVAAFAQAPMGFSYQAVVRDAQNAIVANQPITVSITILQGDNLESAKQVYDEQHNVTTNQNGLFTIVVGKGDSAGSIRTVNWSKGNCYIRTKTDYGESTSQLMSVPYALFAENVAPDNIVNVLNNSEVTNKLNFVSKTDIDNFVTSADVTTTVNTALASYATTDNVNSALANYATTANVNTAINNSLANYTTTAQLQEALAAYTKTEDMPEGVNLTGYAKTEDIAAAYTKTEDLADVATTGNYSDLTGTPTIPTVPTNVSAFTNDANYLKTTDAASTYATKESLKPVATTGSYNDLTNTPTIPSRVSDLIDGANYVTTDNSYTKTDVDELVNVLKKKVAELQGEGAAKGTALFSVAADRQVYFSQGNLQYQASTGKWRFAENQYDIIGSDNANISSTYSGWIDLFGWGTSGWDGGTAVACQPYSTSETNTDYGPTYSSVSGAKNDLTGDNAEYDWGVHNAISNGGDVANVWRTLTVEEWKYLLNTRTTASGMRYAKAIVHNVKGLVILPDNWNAAIYTFSRTNAPKASFEAVSDEIWSTIEAAGAVFLPVAGVRSGSSVTDVGSLAVYGSSSAYDADNASVMWFYSSNVLTGNFSRISGQSVRLVREISAVQDAQNAQNAANAQNFGDMPLTTLNVKIIGYKDNAGTIKFLGHEWSVNSGEQNYSFKVPAYSPVFLTIDLTEGTGTVYYYQLLLNNEFIERNGNTHDIYNDKINGLIGPFPNSVNNLEIHMNYKAN